MQDSMNDLLKIAYQDNTISWLITKTLFLSLSNKKNPKHTS